MPTYGNSDLLLRTPCPEPDNSIADMACRASGRIISKSVTVTGTGSVKTNVIKLTGSVKVINQWALITAVRTLSNMTNIYADLWDGTNAVELTKPTGCVLSGATVGTFFHKDKVYTEPYTVNKSDQCRMCEAINKDAIPFVITQKNGVATYIRFCYDTTDAPIDFDMTVWFEYRHLNGGDIAFL